MKYAPIDIKCPNCGDLAKFEEPFEFVSSKNVDANDTRQSHRWGSWIVVERFPSQYSWKPPSTSQQYLRGGGSSGKGGYPLLTNGLVLCSNCHVNNKHKLQWPSDAYWQWNVRGELLWAWDKEHAEAILQYVKQTIRPSKRSYSLRYIPSHFLSAKVRDIVVQIMERSVNA